MRRFVLLSIACIFCVSHSLFAKTPQIDEIIKAVQLRSQSAYDSLQSMTFEGHSQIHIYVSAGILDFRKMLYQRENFFRGFWEKPDSLRIVYLADANSAADSAVTALPNQLPNPFPYTHSLSQATSNLDSNLTKTPLYPFSPGAENVYTYRLLYSVGTDENLVYTIHVEPKDNRVPAVIGTFQIDPHRHVVVGSDITLNEACRFSKVSAKREGRRTSISIGGIDDFRIKTTFLLYYNTFWLPARVIESGTFNRMGIRAGMERITEFDLYDINTVAPDTLVNQAVTFQPDSFFQQQLVMLNPDSLERIRKRLLTDIENDAESDDLFRSLIRSEVMRTYATNTKLAYGFDRYVAPLKRIADVVQYNRVDGLRLSYGYQATNLFIPRSMLGLQAGYGFGDRKWKYRATLLHYPDTRQRWMIEGNAYRTLSFADNYPWMSTGRNTLSSFLFKQDFRNYFYASGATLGISYRMTDHTALKLTAILERETSADNHADFSLLHRKDEFRSNPASAEGMFRGMQAMFSYQTFATEFKLELLHSPREFFNSDFNFTKIQAQFRQRFSAVGPGQLNGFLSAGASRGLLPTQHLFYFGGKSFLHYYGQFRGVEPFAFTGDRMASAVLDYTIPGSSLADAGLKLPVITKLQFTTWYGAGWSDLSGKHVPYPDNFSTAATDGYHEVGCAIGDRLNFLRLDVVHNNISGTGVSVNFNVLR
ncbi:hypothetical protein JW960_26135 [candidate division KSB1 bacterium]|nr:hypothetical protein [candidate division KSB1 bacterium]